MRTLLSGSNGKRGREDLGSGLLTRLNPLRKSIMILRVEDRVPGAPVCTYVVKFDFLPGQLELHYSKGLGEKQVKNNLKEIYGQLRRLGY